MNDILKQRFIQLICRHTGLYVREQDRENVIRKIGTRIKCLRFSHPEDYYQLLEAQSQQSDREWQNLAILLTTCETYFFRDRGQFDLLKNYIFPQLIEAKRREASTYGLEKPRLRCWSAGCSSGEEPYSLALMLRDLVPDINDWNLFILGTDINQEALNKAREGLYNSWSFRLLEPNLPQQYFHQRKSGLWELDQRIRQMVTFRYGNLVKDNFPDHNSEIHQMDLILCRNVFVYFDAQAIDVVLEKFFHTIQPGGYLMTAHTELYGKDLSRWQVTMLPESILYQRGGEVQSQGSVPPLTWSLPNPSNQAIASPFLTEKLPNSLFPTEQKTEQSNSLEFYQPPASTNQVSDLSIQTNIQPTVLFEAARSFFCNQSYAEAIQTAKQVIQLQPNHFEAYYLLAQAYANLGNHHQAQFYCNQAVKVNALSVLPYYLLAEIAEEKGNLEEAKSILKMIIYLEPYSVSAYLELGSIYQKEGNNKRAKKMFFYAFELLQKLPPSGTVEHQGKSKVSELLLYVQKMLSICT